MPDQTQTFSTGRIMVQTDNMGRPQFRARLVKSGRILTSSGKPGNIEVPQEAIKDAVEAGKFNGLAVFVDHPEWFKNASVKALVAVTHSAEYNEVTESADATLRFYTKGEEGSPQLAQEIVSILNMMLDDTKDNYKPPNIGISIVFWPKWKPRDNPEDPLVLDEFMKIDSADIVFSPAADGRILEALSTHFRGKGEETMPETLETEETAVTEQPQSLTAKKLKDWESATAAVGGRQIILSSTLPQTAKEKLLKQSFDSPDAVLTAIEEEEKYLAALSENAVVQMPGRHPRGAGGVQIFMTTPMEHAANAVNYLFGDLDAKVPEPMLRNPAQLYGALTGDYEWYGRFNKERTMFTGADTTTLANLAVDAMNKVIMNQMARLTYYRWYEQIVVPTPNDGSLHDMKWISFGGITTLPVVGEKESYTELAVDDVKEADSFIKYGGYVGITREMFRKSEIQRIQAVPKALASAAVKTRSAKIAAIFTVNSGTGPTLDQDSTVLFHSNHGSNVQTTALGTDETAWKAATIECFKMTEVSSGDRIGVMAKYCLVPVDLYHQALSVFGYGDGLPTSYEVFSQERSPDDPRPVPICVPNWTDANDWAYLADPRLWPVIHMSFSQDPSGRGFPPPELFSVASETAGLMFTNDTLPIKVRDEFAYGVNGWRGIGKRNVT